MVIRYTVFVFEITYPVKFPYSTKYPYPVNVHLFLQYLKLGLPYSVKFPYTVEFIYPARFPWPT